MGTPAKGRGPGSNVIGRRSGLNYINSPLPILPLTTLSDSDSGTDLDLPDPMSFLQRSPMMGEERTRSRSRSPSNVPETPESTTGMQAKEPIVASVAAIETPDSQGQVGRKRKQQPVAKTLEVDSNLTLLDENTGGATDKVEGPQAKRGRPAATPTGSVEKQPRSARSKAAPASATEAGDSPRLCLLATGLTEAQTTRLRRAAKQAQALGIVASIEIVGSPAELLHNAAQLVTKDSLWPASTLTHLVTSANKGGRTTRTFKYLVGLVSGAWVVKMEWLLESVKAKRLVAESDYAIAGDTAMPHCFLSGPRPLGQLLSGYSVHVWDSSEKAVASSAHTRDELLDLIRAAGAEIVDKCPEYSAGDDGNVSNSGVAGLGVRKSGDKAISSLPDKYRRLFEIPVHKHKTIIVVDSSDKLNAIVEQTGGTYAWRNKSWLFDCISANMVL
ncbi:hypothetical protein GGI20_004932 [Coemansia sp. BCRC 34301]|nr:hypothetical protein GGI20_004932 [Coemansia sp. BCRC 34301]